MLKQKGDCEFHAFRTARNSSKPQKIIGRCKIPLRVGCGRWLSVSVLVVDGEVLFIIGKSTLKQYKRIESYDQGWVEMTTRQGKVKLHTATSHAVGHACIPLKPINARENIAESIAESMICSLKDIVFDR